MKFQDYLQTKILEENPTRDFKALVELLAQKTDFFTAPASSKYHLAFAGGLAIHTLGVIRNIKQQLETNEWDISLESACKCALLHDLCKTDFYIKQADGTYLYDLQKAKQHGTRSITLAKELGIELTDKEAALIEFHMGPFASAHSLSGIDDILTLQEAKNRLHEVKEYQSKYSNAVQAFPEILAMYISDHNSSVQEKDITEQKVKEEFEEYDNTWTM